MQFITIIDFFLFPIYLFFLYFFIRVIARKYNGTPLRKYFITAFFLHMAGSFLYAMVIQYYYGYGDSFGFYMGSNFIRDVIKEGVNPFKILFMSSEELIKPHNQVMISGAELPTGISANPNFIIMKISAVLSYICFNSYLVITLFFGLFSFAGLWKLFNTFNNILGKKGEKLLAYTILYTPSIWFWGSGLIKDSVCLGLVGFIIYFLHKLFILKKFSVKDLVILVIMVYFLYSLKSYIASLLIVSAALGYVILILKKSRQNFIKFALVILILAVSSVVIFINMASSIESLLQESKEQIEIYKGAYAYAEVEDENSMAGFKGSDFELTVNSFILRSPLAMFSTLFRPFLWESKKPIIFLSALESFLMLIGLLYVMKKTGIRSFFYLLFSEPYIFFAFIFTLLLAAVVGFTTFNFGTLVRYRLPILPFYFFMLIGIYTKSRISGLTPHAKNKPTAVDLVNEID